MLSIALLLNITFFHCILHEKNILQLLVRFITLDFDSGENTNDYLKTSQKFLSTSERKQYLKS